MRYTKLPSYFLEDGKVYFADLYLNIFQIESYSESDLSFTHPELGNTVSRSTTTLTTKTGAEYNIDIPIDEFNMLVNQ